MPEVTITKDNWWPLVEEVKVKHKDVPIWKALSVYYNVCVDSILDPLSKSIVATYLRLNGMISGGLANENFESLQRLPAVYVAGCDCINAERDRIKQHG